MLTLPQGIAFLAWRNAELAGIVLGRVNLAGKFLRSVRGAGC